MLTAKDIHKYFGELWVLKGVDLEIRTGEIVSIVGPSGSGKSTLLHILGTLDRPAKGEIFLGDQQINGLSGKPMAAFRNKHMGFVFQFHHLLPEFTALENVSIPAWIAGRKKKKLRKKPEHCWNPSASETDWSINHRPFPVESSKELL